MSASANNEMEIMKAQMQQAVDALIREKGNVVRRSDIKEACVKAGITNERLIWNNLCRADFRAAGRGMYDISKFGQGGFRKARGVKIEDTSTQAPAPTVEESEAKASESL